MAIDCIRQVGVDNPTLLQQKLLDLIKSNNFKTGDFFMELRQAIARSKITPPLLETLPILGKDQVIARLQNYIDTSQT
jgi:glutamyl/glutaminyl-tRNA synthetase